MQRPGDLPGRAKEIKDGGDPLLVSNSQASAQALIQGGITYDQGDACRIHGRLQEALHNAGYTFERAMCSLDWLIAEDRWKLAGFQTPADFIASLDFTKLRVSVEQRKEFVRFATAAGATQRQIAGALGVSQMTVSRETNVSTAATDAKKTNSSGAPLETNVSAPWTDLDADPSKLAKRQQQQSEKRAAALERAAKLSKRNAALPADQRKYGVILADPPWRYETLLVGDIGRSVANQYPTMTQAEIEALPVSTLATKDCALFLWCIMPQLPEALAVIRAWGFEYKTCAFVYVKQNPDGSGLFNGLGMWTRSSAEMCLLATRGSPRRLNADVRQVIIEPRREHSRKPDTVAERIERLVPGPYIELFSRQPRNGWDSWGNQA